MEERPQACSSLEKPYRATACRSEYIFEIEQLIFGESFEIQVSRLKLFRSKDFEISEEVLNYLAYEKNELFKNRTQ